VQRTSKLLLGGTYSLEIGAWIWEFGRALINPKRFVDALGEYSESAPGRASVDQEIATLEAAGLLSRFTPDGPPIQEAYYERSHDAVYFEMCHRMREEILEQQEPAARHVGPAE
jgi:hypothetical protein